jgi:hypothetical protein
MSTPGFLRGMVEQCSTGLSFGMRAEEVTSEAAELNRDRCHCD